MWNFRQKFDNFDLLGLSIKEEMLKLSNNCGKLIFAASLTDWPRLQLRTDLTCWMFFRTWIKLAANRLPIQESSELSEVSLYVCV